MKRIFFPLLVTVLCVSCKRDIHPCKSFTEIKGREQSVDVSAITSSDLRDTLAKYPQLVPYWTKNNDYLSTMNCHVYYNDLPVFSDQYTLNKYYLTGEIDFFGQFLKTTLSLSLEPTVNIATAVKKAKQYINFDHTCISYQLGLYNITAGSNVANYRLVWRVSDSQKSYIYVMVDAVTGEMILYDDGTRGIN